MTNQTDARIPGVGGKALDVACIKQTLPASCSLRRQLSFAFIITDAIH